MDDLPGETSHFFLFAGAILSCWIPFQVIADGATLPVVLVVCLPYLLVALETYRYCRWHDGVGAWNPWLGDYVCLKLKPRERGTIIDKVPDRWGIRYVIYWDQPIDLKTGHLEESTPVCLSALLPIRRSPIPRLG